MQETVQNIQDLESTGPITSLSLYCFGSPSFFVTTTLLYRFCRQRISVNRIGPDGWKESIAELIDGYLNKCTLFSYFGWHNFIKVEKTYLSKIKIMFPFQSKQVVIVYFY